MYFLKKRDDYLPIVIKQAQDDTTSAGSPVPASEPQDIPDSTNVVSSPQDLCDPVGESRDVRDSTDMVSTIQVSSDTAGKTCDSQELADLGLSDPVIESCDVHDSTDVASILQHTDQSGSQRSSNRPQSALQENQNLEMDSWGASCSGMGLERQPTPMQANTAI